MIFTDQWIVTNDMTYRRRWICVAALDNKIYVTGGDDDRRTRSHVDRYDPDTNTNSLVGNMNVPRSGHSLVSLHGKLYAIGGNFVGDLADSVEVYDPNNNTWTLLHKLDGKVAHTGAGLISSWSWKYHVE